MVVPLARESYQVNQLKVKQIEKFINTVNMKIKIVTLFFILSYIFGEVSIVYFK